jgi:hypothetical protein
MLIVKSLVETCSACPSQWEGMTADNRKLYIRYRWGHLTVQIGLQDDPNENAAVCGEYIYNESVGDDYDGFMTLDELKGHTIGVLHFSDLIEEYKPAERELSEAQMKLLKEIFNRG